MLRRLVPALDRATRCQPLPHRPHPLLHEQELLTIEDEDPRGQVRIVEAIGIAPRAVEGRLGLHVVEFGATLRAVRGRMVSHTHDPGHKNIRIFTLNFRDALARPRGLRHHGGHLFIRFTNIINNRPIKLKH